MNWVIGQETIGGGFKQVLCTGRGSPGSGGSPLCWWSRPISLARTGCGPSVLPAAGIRLRARFRPCKPQPRGGLFLSVTQAISQTAEPFLPRHPPRGLISGIASIKSLYAWGPGLPASHPIEPRGRQEAGDWSRSPAAKTVRSPISRETISWSDSSRVVFLEKPKRGFAIALSARKCGRSLQGSLGFFGWAGDMAVAQGEPALPHVDGKR